MNKTNFIDNNLVFNKFYDKDVLTVIFYELPGYFPESIKEAFKELSSTIRIIMASFLET